MQMAVEGNRVRREIMALSPTVEAMLETAKRDNRKGNYRIYQLYKMRLECMDLPSVDYEEAVKRLASALRV